MQRASKRVAPTAVGLLVGCALNFVLLTLLAIGARALKPPSFADATVLRLDLRRQAASDRAAIPPPAFPTDGPSPPRRAPDRTSPAKASSAGSPPLSSALTAPDLRSDAIPAPQRPAAGDGVGLAAAQAVLRRLHDCAAVYAEKTGDGSKCGYRADFATPTISSVSEERRLEFDTGKMRTDDLLAANRNLQRQTFQPEGSNAARLGCNLSHGKWRCGSY